MRFDSKRAYHTRNMWAATRHVQEVTVDSVHVRAQAGGGGCPRRARDAASVSPASARVRRTTYYMLVQDTCTCSSKGSSTSTRVYARRDAGARFMHAPRMAARCSNISADSQPLVMYRRCLFRCGTWMRCRNVHCTDVATHACEPSDPVCRSG